MSRPRVLVIDDDPLFRSLMMSMLRKEYLVSVASGGEEGYYKALEHAPDLAVIDIRMPGWDGLRTLSAFRTHQTLAKTPIIMLTADASRHTVMSAIQGGASDYVLKTCLNRDDFLRKVRKLLKLIDSTAEADPLTTAAEPAAPEPAQAASAAEPVPVPVEPALESPAERQLVAAAAAQEEAELQSIIDNWE
jgi:CheY-like chemotaxis protein